MAAIPAQDEVGGTVTKNPYDNENTFGFDVGGPVVKDKLFFFGAAQWDRERLSATAQCSSCPPRLGSPRSILYPTNANMQLFLKAIGNLAATPLAGAMPTTVALLGGNTVDLYNFQVQNVSTASNDVNWNVRMDWQAGDTDRLTGSYIRDISTLTPDNFANPTRSLASRHNREDRRSCFANGSIPYLPKW